MKALILTFLLFSCGDNSDACEGKPPTSYLGEVVHCQGFTPGICVSDKGPGGPVMCRMPCRDDGKSLCGDDSVSKIPFFATSTTTTDKNGNISSVCYCEPNPLWPDREVWPQWEDDWSPNY